MASRENRAFFTALGRASGGALLFSLPLLMTMEMWWLGFAIDRLRLALLVIASLPLLVGLAYYSGFKKDLSLEEMVIDAFVAYAVGFVMSAVVLGLLGIIRPEMSLDEVVGKTLLQAVPGSIGAMFANSQLGQNEQGNEGDRKSSPGYFGELFLMVAGALFLAFNVAPTEEMVLIAYKMSAPHTLALVVVSLVVMHAFVYALEFRGQEAIPEGETTWGVFLRFTVVGYALALLVSLYMLWTFGRTEGLAPTEVIMTTLVLGFPAAVGAATARLVL